MSCSLIGRRRIAANMLLRGGRLLQNPVVELGSDGTILSVVTDEHRTEGGSAAMDSSVSTEFYSGIMVAGFVNAHSHLELSYLKGAIPSGGGFAKFAATIGAVRDHFSEAERLAAIERAEAEMVREGIVAVGDIVNGTTSYHTKSAGRVEYRNFAELFGLRCSDMSPIEPLLHLPNTEATPHSLYSLNDPILREIARSGDMARPLSIHFMESESEQQLFNRTGGLYEWYSKAGFECDFLDYSSPAERLISVVPRDRSVMLVHNCYVTQRDIDLIMNHFTAPVWWVLCPRSNRYISGQEAPHKLLYSNGLRVCVGTDSLASNWSLSMMEELRLMSEIPLVDRLMWATQNGAEALGLCGFGEIEVGAAPGVNIISGIDYNKMQLTDRSIIRKIR